MEQISITRSNEYNNYLVSFDIYIDNQLIGKIANGETVKLEITKGLHNIYIKHYFLKSKVINFETFSKNNIKFMVSGTKKGNWTLPLSLILILIASLTIDKIFNNEIILCSILIFFIAYIFIMFRNKYITLQLV
jgi:hypothetical protein